MNRVHLVLLWHMHQPQYKDPSTGRFVMPWTRLHATKDYWGMVKMLEEFPSVHMTFNAVPSLVAQLEEYAGGQFDEPVFQLAFKPAAELQPDEKLELLDRAFQLNRENLMRRWPRFVELYNRLQEEGREAAAENFGPRDWCDLQVLSQLAWMDEIWLADDDVVSELSHRGANFTEEDKQAFKLRVLALLADVLPAYRRAAASGQIEISTTPFYHPILPLLCDTDIARESNPATPLPQPSFRHPEDAREQLVRARQSHERVFGAPPAGLWPSEGSVSNAALDLAAEMGFQWFATDEGVLGRTLNLGFWRDTAGIPSNAERLYSPLRVRRNGKEVVGFFRDHYLSDLIGFVYSRMLGVAAAEDLYRRIRQIGERVTPGRPLTVTLILDGENAWEYYPGNGREFLREFYKRIAADPDIRALTMSEAVREAGEIPTVENIFPASWINANFDVWIGHAEDVRAWDFLRNARDFYSRAEKRLKEGAPDAPNALQFAAAYESLLAAEGSDWNWWYGPEHSSASDPEFDALYRKHLTEVYAVLGAEAPEELAHPIKKRPERAFVVPPGAFLEVQVDGRVSSYFEWLGAGLYSADRQSGAMHGRSYTLHELHYGFDENNFYLRVEPFREAMEELQECEFRVTIAAQDELRIVAHVEEGKLQRFEVERGDACLLNLPEGITVAFGRILEVRIPREMIFPPHVTRPSPALSEAEGPLDTDSSSLPPVSSPLATHHSPLATSSFGLAASVWEGGLPIDVLPSEGFLEIKLGPDNFSW
ncbi:MAG: glycoside hydrolase family 57 protein [Acidobacteria bacterium]|nr:glycoside hydrolase family 57 protein [Acidobacteriota bacterium]